MSAEETPKKTALIVIDMLNPYEHEDADPLVESVREVLPQVQALLDAARRGGVLTVYVNDNQDDWTAGKHELTEGARRGRDAALIDPIAPAEDVPLLVKARHSGFYETQLEYLLKEHEIERVVLTGQVTEQCVLYTALDAYVRHFDVVVPTDAVAHIHPDLAEASLRMMETNMRAELLPTDAACRQLTGEPATAGARD